ncbi:hypothetical protein vseg_011029 [Gypsophila vaccaria]
MDDSISTTNDNKRARSLVSESECSSEASGWSLYIDDSIVSSSIECSSLCSEPQSSVANDVCVASARSVAKKRKTRACFVDRDLEDTASSPVSHSEVQELENMRIKFHGAETDDDLRMLIPTEIVEANHDSYSKAKRNTSYQIGEAVRSKFDWEGINYTKLREKGLCLVPVSMLLNSR